MAGCSDNKKWWLSIDSPVTSISGVEENIVSEKKSFAHSESVCLAPVVGEFGRGGRGRP